MSRFSFTSFLKKRAFVFVLAGCFSLGACDTSPNVEALRLGAPPEGAVSLRALETRRFDTGDEVQMLSAAAQTLQDLGFTLTETSREVGLLVGVKQRDAQEAGEVASQVALSLVAGVLFGIHYDPNWDKEQSINATLVVIPNSAAGQTDVRVSFDRLVTRTDNTRRADLIQEPEIYQSFFEKLSEAVFLEAHDI